MRDSMLRLFTNPPTVTSHNIKIEYSLLILELSTHMLLITFIIVSVVGITKLRSQVPKDPWSKQYARVITSKRISFDHAFILEPQI